MIKIVNESNLAANSSANFGGPSSSDPSNNNTMVAVGKRVRIQTNNVDLSIQEHIAAQERMHGSKSSRKKKDRNQTYDNDAKSKGSYNSIERRKGRAKQPSPLRDKSLKKGMYNTVNDGFFRKQSHSPSQDEDPLGRGSPTLPQKKRKIKKSKKRGNKAHKHSGERTAVSSIVVPPIEVTGQHNTSI